MAKSRAASQEIGRRIARGHQSSLPVKVGTIASYAATVCDAVHPKTILGFEW
jgi:hypothetical protein